MRTLKCSELHPNLRPGVTIKRLCKDDGNWDTVDFSSCTSLPDATPIIIVSFEVNASNSDAEVVSETVSVFKYQHIISLNVHTALLMLALVFTHVRLNNPTTPWAKLFQGFRKLPLDF